MLFLGQGDWVEDYQIKQLHQSRNPIKQTKKIENHVGNLLESIIIFEQEDLLKNFKDRNKPEKKENMAMFQSCSGFLLVIYFPLFFSEAAFGVAKEIGERWRVYKVKRICEWDQESSLILTK